MVVPNVSLLGEKLDCLIDHYLFVRVVLVHMQCSSEYDPVEKASESQSQPSRKRRFATAISVVGSLKGVMGEHPNHYHDGMGLDV